MPESHPPKFFTHESLSKLSLDYLVLVLFVRSRSDAFPLAIDIANKAQLFAERDLKNLTIYVSGFDATFEGAMRALDLIHYVRGWKGTHFYAQGRMVIGEMEQAFRLEAVLRCFADSCAARDYRAYCFRLIDDPCDPLMPNWNLEHVMSNFRNPETKAETGTYVFPCKHMLQWFSAQRDHPSSVQDQIQADGVDKMCDACPRFNPDDFRKLK